MNGFGEHWRNRNHFLKEARRLFGPFYILTILEVTGEHIQKGNIYATPICVYLWSKITGKSFKAYSPAPSYTGVSLLHPKDVEKV